MINVLSGNVFLAAYISFIVYWLAVLLFGANYPVFAEILNGVRAATAVSVLVLYGRVALEAMRSSKTSRVHYLILGIMLTWASYTFASIWTAGGRLLDYPASLVDSSITGMCAWMTILGGMLHLSAPEGAAEGIEGTSWKRITIAIGVGCTIAGAVIASAWWLAKDTIQ